jgi:DNA excision repair protein ERCC-1
MVSQVNPNAVLVSKRQDGNPVLKHIRNVRWQFADIVPDYQMGAQTCALFLSLRYFQEYAALHPFEFRRHERQRKPCVLCDPSEA